jgi:hypothetical protein
MAPAGSQSKKTPHSPQVRRSKFLYINRQNWPV